MIRTSFCAGVNRHHLSQKIIHESHINPKNFTNASFYRQDSVPCSITLLFNIRDQHQTFIAYISRFVLERDVEQLHVLVVFKRNSTRAHKIRVPEVCVPWLTISRYLVLIFFLLTLLARILSWVYAGMQGPSLPRSLVAPLYSLCH